ncbi:Protein disulfide-isomerase MPD1 [Spathaspora sp. JA1]|nr:Protein disulfide-isomerase MPD1 [Spathaspora sp. JA1]
MSQLHVTTRSPSGAPYEEFIKLFLVESSPVHLHAISAKTTISTILLILVAFGSLSVIFLGGDAKKRDIPSYILYSLVASLSIGLSAIEISNFVGNTTMLLKFLTIFSLVSFVLASVDEYHYDPNIFELTPETFNKVVHKSNYTTIVKFYAPWCGHCRNLKPIYQKLGKLVHQDAKYAINVATVNCDQEYNKPLCSRYQIQGFPTVMVFRPPKYVPGESNQVQNHASELYQGERSVKAMASFLTSRLKNYVKKFPNIQSQSLNTWFNEVEGPKVLLVSDKKSISPLFRSLAIDFLTRVNFGMVSNTFVDEHILDINGTKIEVPGSKNSTLFYYDENKKTIVKYEGKLKDIVEISQWIIDVAGVKPIEGSLSKREEKFYSKYRKGEKVEKKNKSKSN